MSSSVHLKDEVITVAYQNLLSIAQWYGSFGNVIFIISKLAQMENPFKEQQKGCILCNITVDYRNTQVSEDRGKNRKHNAFNSQLCDSV